MKDVRQHKIQIETGIALVGVLVIIGLLSMIAISLLFRMQAAAVASSNSLRSEQAWAVTLSGLDRAIDIVSDPSRTTLGWINNPTDFEHQIVYDDGENKWYFSVFRRGTLDMDKITFGVVDEASKLPFNGTNVLQLMKVPNVTLAAAEALADFVDADSITRENGAEQNLYDTIPVSYSIPNKPVSFLDELLMAQGIYAGHIYGEDANRNHKLDMNENDADTQFPPDNQDGNLGDGIHRFFTLYSRDWNVNQRNQPRININSTPLDPVPEELSEEMVIFLNAKRNANEPIESLIDLVDATFIVTDENQARRELKSGITSAELGQLMDLYTTDTNRIRSGRVNINTAPSDILAQLEGIDETLADRIVSTRQGLNSETSHSIAWLLEAGLLDSEQLKKIENLISTRSFQFQIQVIGYALPSGKYNVIEAVVDLIGSRPRIVYLRDLTKLGVPYHFDPTKELNISNND